MDRVLRLTGLTSAEAPAPDTLQVGSMIERLWNDGQWYDAVVESASQDKYTLCYPATKDHPKQTTEQVNKTDFEFGVEWRVSHLVLMKIHLIKNESVHVSESVLAVESAAQPRALGLALQRQ